jgi:NADH-quinone oxidoreductase subunit L
MLHSLNILGWVPVLPLLVCGILAVVPACRRGWAAPLATAALALGFLISAAALWEVSAHPAQIQVKNFTWLEFGNTPLRLGWVMDPLSCIMLVMVTFVGAWIFAFSAGYMASDPNLTRFYCFLSLFSAAMLGLVLANNLLLLFMCWEVMGLASYLLIGFWHQKPSAAAAAKKAFITTRIGDIGLFLGMLWLYSETGTLLFYDQGSGCLESGAVGSIASKAIGAGMMASTAISLLIFCGAMGKSGQVPLHVWLPDAMEGPTPVSALIHAATMVAAGVFLMARVFPLVSAVHPPTAELAATVSTALQAMAWIGAITALFAACVACAQSDIKRTLAYSTVSQLGYMFLGLATGGVAVGMLHLVTHAFFKSLLFLGAGSVIHGCNEEQDIRHMGGLRRFMPVTFLTYAVGMMALSGLPLFFSGFWSKDEILHSAALWSPSKAPFLIGLVGAVLTAFYMTRQMIYVFLGDHRGRPSADDEGHLTQSTPPHESSSMMTRPLIVLATCTVLLSFIATPVWPWFHAFMDGHPVELHSSINVGVVAIILLSNLAVGFGIWAGWFLYRRLKPTNLVHQDPLEARFPATFQFLRNRAYFDELYEMSFVKWMKGFGDISDWVDRKAIEGTVRMIGSLGLALAWLARLTDEFAIDLGFHEGCKAARRTAHRVGLIQNGQVHRYLRILGVGVVAFALWILWR